jgi:Kdo2-lipid IVA lauroyltransferase/acyltransferase
MNHPSLRHRVEYAAFRFARWLLVLLPEPVSLGVGEMLGWLAGDVLRIRRTVVDQNLARAFPDRSPRWRRRVAGASFRHLGREGVSTFRLGSVPTERLLEATEVVGLEGLQRGLAKGRGAIVVTGHLGNWEIGGAALAVRGVPVDAVALVQANRLFDRDLVETRARLGVRVITRGAAPKEVLRTLAGRRVAALVADQNARGAGVFVDFFGHPASTFRGPALFSLRTGAPLFLGVALRTSRHPQRYRIVLEEVAIEPSGDLEADVLALTVAHVGALERWVRRAPDQYFWQHKRWKTRPGMGGPEPPEPPPGEGTQEPGGGAAV